MATPHSFPAPLSPSHSKRNSLPLPPSLNPPLSPRSHQMSSSKPQSPAMHSPPPVHSSTHTGGIQPSAAFFRPSKPIYQPQYDYSRPSSPASTHIPEHDPDHEHELGHFPQDDRAPEQSFISLKRIKQSREPLLPAPVSAPSSHPRAIPLTSSSSTPLSPSRIVRNSFDRVLTIGRGLSFDSIRKSQSQSPTIASNHAPSSQPQPIPHSSDLRQNASFRQKAKPSASITDEENAYSPHYKHPHHSLDIHPTHSRPHSQSHSAPSPSPDPSFVPTPPNRRPPLSAVPVLDPVTQKPLRRYQLHPSRNSFFFRGHILTGGDTPYAFIASFTVLFTISGVWFGTTAVWWWKHKSPAVAAVGAYLALLAISSMLAAATIDPGILPRNLDPEPPYPATSPSDGGVRVPMPRDLKVRSDVVRVKYCPTCKTYRPPRSSHCKMCDNCVDGCDHHCQWVNNCVGRRNYTTFFVLLVSATTGLLLFIITAALHLFFLTRQTSPHLDFAHALRDRAHGGVGSAVVFCLSMCVIWPVGALLSYHMRLLLLNITTIEQIRNQAHKTLIPGPAPPNPFSHGNWRRNLLAVLGRPQGYSWLDAAGVVVEDKREVNPGLLGGGAYGERERERVEDEGKHLGVGVDEMEMDVVDGHGHEHEREESERGLGTGGRQQLLHLHRQHPHQLGEEEQGV